MLPGRGSGVSQSSVLEPFDLPDFPHDGVLALFTVLAQVIEGDVGPDFPDLPSDGDVGPDFPDLPSEGDVGPDLPDLPSEGDVGPDLPDLPSDGDVGPDLPDLPSDGDVGPDLPLLPSEGVFADLSFSHTSRTAIHSTKTSPGDGEVFVGGQSPSLDLLLLLLQPPLPDFN